MQPFRILKSAVAAALLFSTATALASDEEPPPIDHSQEYADCITLAQRMPDEAFESALTWESVGGGSAARHCAAVALINVGEFAEAATRLEAIAKDTPVDKPQLAADLLGQAGQAWLMAGMVERAYAAQTAALELAPEDVDLLIDRSVTLADAANYWEAIDDLNRANALAPNRADVLVLRATAYRYVDGLELARADIEQALRIEPQNADALLERGILRRLAGDADGARRDWLQVAMLAAGTPTADAAQMNLETLDLKTE
ncbi:hypothetical protein [Rhodospirillaceae bacterium SYSU D60014]|uniref:hypothetical protein n=1 Tax=Virgifigura deserti TaxID=2268457 RepID=UPI000E6663AF